MNVLEFHIWGSRVDQVEKPDRIVFDLDPDVGLGFEDVRRAAFDLRDRLADLGLTTFPDALRRQGHSRHRAADAPGRMAGGEGLLPRLRRHARRGGAGALRRQHGEGEAQGAHLRRLSAQRARLDGDRALLDARPRQARRSPRRSPGRKSKTVAGANVFTVADHAGARAARSATRGRAISTCSQSITKAMMKAVDAG